MARSFTRGRWFVSIDRSQAPWHESLWISHGWGRDTIWGVREPRAHYQSVWHLATPFRIPRVGYAKFILYYDERGHPDLHESFADFLLEHRELFSDAQFARAVEHSPTLRARVNGSE